MTREDLLQEIWGGRALSDWAISAAIKALRVALDDSPRERAFVRTVHSRGFRFVAPVTAKRREDGSGDTAKAAILVRCLRFSRPEQDQEYRADGRPKT